MKRFTQYLYEYQKEKRVRNIGFVKAEQDKKSCVLQMQGRGMEVRPDEELKVYLFYQKGDGCEAAYQGTVPKKKPIVSCTLEFTEEDIGNADSIEDILGVLLLEPGGRRYAAIWGGGTVNVDEISTEVKKEEPAVSEKDGYSQEEISEESNDKPELMETVSTVEETLESEEVVPEKAAPVQESEQDNGQKLEQEEMQEPEQTNCCKKIQRRDLARLPRKDWRLANNNFLLHGFYNYHHLLWIEENGELYIGVPGVNHAREIQAAKAFGFTQFRHIFEIDVELSEDESNPREDFGYFCRRIVRNE